MIVVDTNVLAHAVLPGDRHELALRVAARDLTWLAPALWRSELRNVLATSMRTRGLRLSDAVEAFEAAQRLVAEFDVEESTEACLAVAAEGGISGYDAEFVVAAQRLGCPLVTADRRLAKAFPRTAVAPEEFVRRS